MYSALSKVNYFLWFIHLERQAKKKKEQNRKYPERPIDQFSKAVVLYLKNESVNQVLFL